MATIMERKNKAGKTKFTAVVRRKGNPVTCATFERKTDAKEWAKKTESEMKAGRYFKTSEAQRHTMAEMIDRYIRDVLPLKSAASVHAQTIQLNWWKGRIGHLAIADVTPAVVAEARDFLLAGDTYRHTRRSPSTVLRYVAALSHVFTVAMREWGWCDDTPVRKVTKPKEPRGRVRFLSDAERARLLVACQESRNPCLYDVVVVALCSGMRKSEILHIKWADVDFNRGMITLHQTKNGERRGVPLVGLALERLQERFKIRRIDNPYVFPAPPRYGEDPKHMDIQSAWDWAVARAEIKDFRFHDLRHSAAAELAMSGATVAELAEILGHRTLQMVKRYSHLSTSHTSGVLERMAAKIFAERAEA